MAAAPVIWAFSQRPLEIDYGIDLVTYDQIPPPFRYLSGGPFQGANDVIVDDFFAGMNHKQVGDMIEVLNNSFRICGIVPHGKGGRKFLSLATMQDLIGAPGRTSVFYLKLDNPKNVNTVEATIKSTPGMERYSVRSMQEYPAGRGNGIAHYCSHVIGLPSVTGGSACSCITSFGAYLSVHYEPVIQKRCRDRVPKTAHPATVLSWAAD